MRVGLGMETDGCNSVWVVVGSSPSSLLFFQSQGLLIQDRMCPQNHMSSRRNSRIKAFYLHPLSHQHPLRTCAMTLSFHHVSLESQTLVWMLIPFSFWYVSVLKGLKYRQNIREKKMSLLQKKTGDRRREITRDLLSTSKVPLRWPSRERSLSVPVSSFPFLFFLKIS